VEGHAGSDDAVFLRSTNNPMSGLMMYLFAYVFVPYTAYRVVVLARTSHKPSIRSKDRERCKRIGA
jgi:hypothetical protein